MDGKANAVADWLSRPPGVPMGTAYTMQKDEEELVDNISAVALSIIDSKTLARDQKACVDVQNMSKRNNTVNLVELGPGVKLLCEMTGTRARPLVPKQSRDLVIRMFHQLSHPGQKETLDKVKASYYWPTMGKDVSRYVQSCQPCQAVKPYKEIRPPMSKIKVPDTRFSELQIDVVGPMSQS